MCGSSSTIYSTTSTGGVWGSNGRINITTTGIATATSAGVIAIKYTITNVAGCSATSNLAITNVAVPAIPSIGYAPGNLVNLQTIGGMCTNRIFTVMGNPNGGVWSKTGVITVSPLGVVNTGNTTGAFTLTYTYSAAASCNSSRTINMNVVACASKGIISQQSTVDGG